GKVEIQAQSDNIEVTAQKAVKVVSATDRIEIAADQGILLTSGGAYIRIKDGNVEVHAPGKIDVKGASHTFAGPASMGYPLPSPRPDQPGQLELLHQYANGEGFKGGKFTVLDASGGVLREGALDAKGHTIVSGLPAGAVQVQFGEDPRNQYDPSSVFKTAQWPAKPMQGADPTATAMSQLGGLLPPGALPAATKLAAIAGQAAQGGIGKALSGQAMGLAQGALANVLPSGAMGAVSGATQLAGMAGQVAQGGVGQAMSLAKGALGSALPSGASAALSQASQLGAAAQQVGALAQAARSAVPALKVL
ncbi:DUF2345 domain-containing protein, partial [Burkholderia seminalis]|uniref:DUF2345 domain-containing protein n=2 Tax=Burkholderia TaxID=32008 RepID=UPI000F986B7A